MKKIVLLILFMLISTNAIANILSTGSVKRLYPSGSTIHFKLNNDCFNNSQTNTYFWFSLDDPSGNAWYSLLLAAAHTGKPVKVSAEKCPDNKQEPVKIRYIYQDF